MFQEFESLTSFSIFQVMPGVYLLALLPRYILRTALEALEEMTCGQYPQHLLRFLFPALVIILILYLQHENSYLHNVNTATRS